MKDELREKMIRVIKDTAQQLINDSEKIVPDCDRWFDLSVDVHIPTMTDKLTDAPHYTVSYSYYPDNSTLDKWFERGVI